MDELAGFSCWPLRPSQGTQTKRQRTTNKKKMKEAQRIEQRHNKLYYAILWLVGFFSKVKCAGCGARALSRMRSAHSKLHVNKMPIAAIRKLPRANNWCTFSFRRCAILIGFFRIICEWFYVFVLSRSLRPIHLLCAMNDSKTTNE